MGCPAKGNVCLLDLLWAFCIPVAVYDCCHQCWFQPVDDSGKNAEDAMLEEKVNLNFEE
jgi:hypothetical protein